MNEAFTLNDCFEGEYKPSIGKFVVGFQGGFDGCDPAQDFALGKDINATNLMGFDLSTNTSNGTVLY